MRRRYLYTPYVGSLSFCSWRIKTKPTQNSVKKLRELGLQPDILVCRTEHELSSDIRRKIALFCNVEKEAVIQSIDAESIYDVPLLMEQEKLDRVALRKLGLKDDTDVDLKHGKNFRKIEKSKTRSSYRSDWKICELEMHINPLLKPLFMEEHQTSVKLNCNGFTLNK